MTIRLKDGTTLSDEKPVADAHANGRAPWRWDDYVRKFETLAPAALDRDARDCFLDAALRASTLTPAEIVALLPALPAGAVEPDAPTGSGIFDHPPAGP